MRRSPQHIGRKGHQFLSQALRPRRIVLYVVFVLLGAVLSVVGIYGISALKLYTERTASSPLPKTSPTPRSAAVAEVTSARPHVRW